MTSSAQMQLGSDRWAAAAQEEDDYTEPGGTVSATKSIYVNVPGEARCDDECTAEAIAIAAVPACLLLSASTTKAEPIVIIK